MDRHDDDAINQLLLDLGIKDFRFGTNLEKDFEPIFALAAPEFTKIAKDAMSLTGISGDWTLSLRIAEHMLERSLPSENDWALTKLWQLRCLVELDRMAEAVALVQSINFPAPLVIFVNYLSGIAYEKLEMPDLAQQKFKAVYSQNPRFRDIADRLLQE